MRILVCVSIEPDLDMILPDTWDSAEATGVVDTSYANRIINCFDESSLELSLKIGESLSQCGEPAIIDVLNVGCGQNDAALQRLLPLGFANVIRVHADRTYGSFDISRIICGEMGAGYDLILTGSKAAEHCGGQTGALIAERLKLPLITGVTAVCAESGGLTLERETVSGFERLSVKTPIVLAIGNVADSALRMATLKQKIAAKARSVEIRHISDNMPFSVGAASPERLIRKRSRRQMTRIERATDSERAAALLELIDKA